MLNKFIRSLRAPHSILTQLGIGQDGDDFKKNVASVNRYDVGYTRLKGREYRFSNFEREMEYILEHFPGWWGCS